MKQQFTNRRHQTVSAAGPSVQPAGLVKDTLRFTKAWLLVAIVLISAVFFRGFWGNDKTVAEAQVRQPTSQQVASAQTQPPFPTIDSSQFTPAQQAMLLLIEQEYAKQPSSYDASVMSYTEGFQESWCADFISWIRYHAGVPFEHQETGYWRIPGVQTLRDYYAGSGAYQPVGDYVPKFGDVAFYFGETPDGNSREHVALVLSVQGDMLTTIGGNETDKGILQIRTNTIAEGERGLTGFGVSRL